MGLPMMKKFLCGFSIRTGALVIGWIALFNSLCVLIPAIALTCTYVENPDKIIDWITNETDNTLYQNTTLTPDEILEEKATIKLIIDLSFALSIIIGIFTTTASTMLLCGIQKKNNCLMLPWLVQAGFSSVLAITSFCSWMLLMPFVTITKNENAFVETYTKIGYTFILFIYTCIPVYCFLIIFTHFRNVKYENRHERNDFQKL